MTRDAINVASYGTLGRPFSQAVRVPDGSTLIFVSGIVSRDASGQLVGVDDIDAQARQVFTSIREILREAGSTMDDVVKITTYATEVEYLNRSIAVRTEFFTNPPPASTGIVVKALNRPELLVEVDAVALGPVEQAD